MSGAAEGIAGLALSAVSVAALFTTCLQCFDIVVAGKNFSEDYEQLFAIFGIQRTRFGLWGESVGLIPNPNDGRCLPYNENIDRRDIRPGIEDILNNIRLLLQKADRIDEGYGLKIVTEQSSNVSMSVGMNIFRDSFERFKSRLKKNQKQKSAWRVTRWAIHDAAKFEVLINRLEKYVDGLEKLTDSLGRLEQRLREEIDTISDVLSLRLLRDASSSHQSSLQNDVSDAASRRITLISERGIDIQTLATASTTYNTGSFATAESKLSSQIGSNPSGDLPLPGAWPKSVNSEPSQKGRRAFQNAYNSGPSLKPNRSSLECFEEHYKCEAHGAAPSCSRCDNNNRSCSFDRELAEYRASKLQGSLIDIGNATLLVDNTKNDEVKPEDMPQNQRLLSELIQKAKIRKPLSFAAGDNHYGEIMETIKAADVASLRQNSAKFLYEADRGSSAAKRMFFELRNIRTGNVPFVSAAPVADSLDKILASIEGPPETPYEGGIFWITVRLSDKDVMGPPLMRFHTKIYHPNISPRGHICADYKEKWNSMFSSGSHNTVTNPGALWYHGKSQCVRWSLGALLTALCGLLASPDVEDPLVPEIAQKYLTDYDGYCEAARLYTQRYASPERPREVDLIFLDDEMNSGKDHDMEISSLVKTEQDSDTISIQRSLRETYDEQFPFGKPSRPWTSDRSISNDEIALVPNLLQTRDEALALYRVTIESHLNDFNRYSVFYHFEDMTRSIRALLIAKWQSHLWWIPTEIDLNYGLLKMIVSLLPKTKEWNRRVALIKLMNDIREYFANLVIEAADITVSKPVPRSKFQPTTYVLTVKADTGQMWNVLLDHPKILKLREVHFVKSVTEEILIQQQWSPNTENVKEFIQTVLKLYQPLLLATKEFLDLMQPTLDLCNDFRPTPYDANHKRVFVQPSKVFSGAAYSTLFADDDGENGSPSPQQAVDREAFFF